MTLHSGLSRLNQSLWMILFTDGTVLWIIEEPLGIDLFIKEIPCISFVAECHQIIVLPKYKTVTTTSC